MEAHYPVFDRIKDPRGNPITKPEKALIHAIIMQESAFDKGAISRVGARGLMQLMPRTARGVAREVKMPYNKRRLTSDPYYNMALGSQYLQGRIDEFNGSYILAIAAYNAGPPPLPQVDCSERRSAQI